MYAKADSSSTYNIKESNKNATDATMIIIAGKSLVVKGVLLFNGVVEFCIIEFMECLSLYTFRLEGNN